MSFKHTDVCSLYFVGYCLLVLTWFDTIDETLIVGICSLSTELIRFSTLRLPQQQLHNSCYLYLSELLIESFCHMYVTVLCSP
jgi:hypothetical protein